MSGSGGGSYYPPDDPNCSQLRVKTNLSTPVATVLAKLKRGDMLSIRYTQPRGPLQAITAKGEVAGSIITSKQVDIISCINDGYSFQAEVLSISGGKCEIEITAV